MNMAHADGGKTNAGVPTYASMEETKAAGEYTGELSKSVGEFVSGVANGTGKLLGSIADGFNKALDFTGKVSDGFASTMVYVFGEGRDKGKAKWKEFAQAVGTLFDPLQTVNDHIEAFQTGFHRGDEEQKPQREGLAVPVNAGTDLTGPEVG